LLKALTIRDFALVQSLDIGFAEGLTVITGESGTGKSILLGALSLVLGERAAADAVRPGASRADISAEFDLSRQDAATAFLDGQALGDEDQPGRCLLRRVVNADGRSRAFINSTPVTLQVLRQLCEQLVDIHGQDENQRLARRDVQQALLDDYGVDPQLLRAYRAWQRAFSQAAALKSDLESRSDRAALLAYQLEELETLALQADEYPKLETAHRRLSQAQDLRQLAADSLAALEEDTVIGRVIRGLAGMDDNHPRLQSALDALRAASDLVADAIRDLRAYDDALDIDPEHLATLDDRLNQVHELARKHRVNPGLLHDHQQTLREELDGLTTDRSALQSLEDTAERERAKFLTHAKELSRQRRLSADEFASAVSACMNSLGIKDGALSLEFQPSESERGLESVEFRVQTNPKYPSGPLDRIASGGERARISLAIQVVAAEKSALPCLVLDEADVGVGGTTADVVGRLLRALAAHTQVICVTHAPQVAALGHHHLCVHKDRQQDTRINVLEDEGRVEELARMLAGADITDKSRDYATTLLREAENRALH
jgi:DNA repair protein RecN (Recombination protein N)